MRKINLLYIAFLLGLFALWKINLRYGWETLVFYGFAENKETEINLEEAVEVRRILVTPGQRVRKGALLAEVVQVDLPLRINDLTHEIEELNVEHQLWQTELHASINRLETERSGKIASLREQIAQIVAESERNRSLVKSLESLPSSPGAETPETGGARELQIKALQTTIEQENRQTDLQIAQLRQQLRASDHPRLVRVHKLEQELASYQVKTERLSITAPYDGLVGNVHCREAQHVAPFNPLITFYEEKPTQVKAYVHESMILRVAVGDSLEVVSSLHPGNRCSGKVSGLGSRIVEIPERLRKMPDLKTYGREVLIDIPPDNRFMQKEKVILNIPAKPGTTVNIRSLWAGNN